MLYPLGYICRYPCGYFDRYLFSQCPLSNGCVKYGLDLDMIHWDYQELARSLRNWPGVAGNTGKMPGSTFSVGLEVRDLKSRVSMKLPDNIGQYLSDRSLVSLLENALARIIEVCLKTVHVCALLEIFVHEFVCVSEASVQTIAQRSRAVYECKLF